MGGEDAELRPGDHFAGLRVDRAVGRHTYRAWDPARDVAVALRLAAAAPVAVEHPNILPVLEAGPGYVTTRWVEGDDLATLLSTGGGLEPGHVLAVAGQVAAALDAAHARGVVHGAVKPANVLLEGDHAWLTGFGSGHPAAGYGEPGEGAAGDVHALGCVIWEALTGRPPYLLGGAPRVRDLRADLPAALDDMVGRSWDGAGALVRAARAALVAG